MESYLDRKPYPFSVHNGCRRERDGKVHYFSTSTLHDQPWTDGMMYILPRDSFFNQYYVIAANLGYTLEAPMGGHSGIYSPEGDLVAQVNGTDFGYVSAEIDLGRVRLWREKEKINPYRRPRLYTALTAQVDGE